MVVRSQERVLTGLERGECDGILGDEWLEPDDLVQSALDEGFLDWFEDFPDRRRRRSIDKRLFCRVLLCGRLVDLPSVAETGRVIFHATTLLDKLGFNFRVMREGGSRTGDERPFDEEALEDYFAKLTAEDYFSHQLTLSRRLLARPELAGKVWLLDCRDTKVPNGHHQEGRHWKAGVLSVCPEGRSSSGAVELWARAADRGSRAGAVVGESGSGGVGTRGNPLADPGCGLRGRALAAQAQGPQR